MKYKYQLVEENEKLKLEIEQLKSILLIEKQHIYQCQERETKLLHEIGDLKKTNLEFVKERNGVLEELNERLIGKNEFIERLEATNKEQAERMLRFRDGYMQDIKEKDEKIASLEEKIFHSSSRQHIVYPADMQLIFPDKENLEKENKRMSERIINLESQREILANDKVALQQRYYKIEQAYIDSKDLNEQLISTNAELRERIESLYNQQNHHEPLITRLRLSWPFQLLFSVISLYFILRCFYMYANEGADLTFHINQF